MTVRGGGVPQVSMASMPWVRMGPPPRSLLPMRIPASWFGSLARRIQGCGTRSFVHQPAAPLELRHPDHRKCAVVLGAVKDEPLRVALTRHPLTAPARAGLSILWVGVAALELHELEGTRADHGQLVERCGDRKEREGPDRSSVPSCSEPSRTRPFGWRYAPSLTAPALDGESISAVGARESPAARVELEKWAWREKKSRPDR